MRFRERSDRRGQEGIDEAFKLVIMPALLLDVGHGSFSHSFEQVLSGYDWAPRHEDWTKTIISHKDSDIRKQLEKNCITIDAVSSVFDKKSPCLLTRPYQQIVSSQLDVDRMNYLVRDSHFSGVATGRFDVRYLTHSIVVVSHGENGTRTLGITPKGVKAYEAFLLARQLINRTVYYHQNVKVLEFMMEHFLQLVIKYMED